MILKDIFVDINEMDGFIIDAMYEVFAEVFEDYSNAYTDYTRRYISIPLWNAYQYSPIAFEDSVLGVEMFKSNFANEVAATSLDFITYARANMWHGYEAHEQIGQSMTVESSATMAPLNGNESINVAQTPIAKGITAQTVNSTAFNSYAAWMNIFQSYFTPNRKKELIESFRWLFSPLGGSSSDLVYETIEPDFADGGMSYTTEPGTILTGFDVEKPQTLQPENIKEGVNIAGVVGTYGGNLTTASVQSLKEAQTIEPPAGLDGFSSIEVRPINDFYVANAGDTVQFEVGDTILYDDGLLEIYLARSEDIGGTFNAGQLASGQSSLTFPHGTYPSKVVFRQASGGSLPPEVMAYNATYTAALLASVTDEGGLVINFNPSQLPTFQGVLLLNFDAKYNGAPARFWLNVPLNMTGINSVSGTVASVSGGAVGNAQSFTGSLVINRVVIPNASSTGFEPKAATFIKG